MLDMIQKRYSVRTFKSEDVPNEAILDMLKAATLAPSGKNRQNWHYVIMKDKSKINALAEAVEAVHDSIVAKVNDVEKTKQLSKFLRYYTLFKDAPVLVAVYAGHYDQPEIDLLKFIQMDEQANALTYINPGLQGVSASLMAFMLEAASLGYGTCWMTGPCFASLAMEDIIPFKKDGYRLVALTPLGVAQGQRMQPARLPLEEIYTFIE